MYKFDFVNTDYQVTTSIQAVNISASILLSSSQISVTSSRSDISYSSRETAISAKISATPVYDLTQMNSSYLSTTLDGGKTSHITFVQMSFSTLSKFSANSTSIINSTAITHTPLVYRDNSNTGTYIATCILLIT